MIIKLIINLIFFIFIMSITSDKHNKQTYSNGSSYIGEMNDGKRNGTGTMSYSNGDIYIGKWKDNLRKGFGKIIYKNQNIYEGEWLNSKKNGFGKMIYSDGNIYEGEWLNSKKNGFGKMIYSDGNIYEGEWLDGKRQGNGKFECDDNKYIGIWKNDIILNGNMCNKDNNYIVYDFISYVNEYDKILPIIWNGICVKNYKVEYEIKNGIKIKN